MKLQLKRLEVAGTHTAGNLFVNGDYECMTLEDTVRAPGVKVYGQTAIPRGTYRVVLTHSPKFKRVLPLLIGVPGFEAIRIHPGNTVNDTEGCILVGQHMKANDLRNSQLAFDALFAKLEAAAKRKEDITLEVV